MTDFVMIKKQKVGLKHVLELPYMLNYKKS